MRAASVWLLVLAACTTEEVMMVDVASVEVLPDVVNAVEGERVQLVAEVRDDRDETHSSVAVEWSSDQPAVASVDANGLVEAHAPGSAVVRATFQGVSGQTDVHVLRGPFVRTGRSSVDMFTAPGASPEPESVGVDNGGAGSLDGLGVVVVHRQGQPADWLRAELSGTRAPAQLNLVARSDQLSSGMYDADVRIISTTSPDTAVVAVALSVAGFEVTEVGGESTVSEGGAPQHLSVVLRARPRAPVVLVVNSADPGELDVSPASLRFTPATWSTAQSVTLRAVDDAEDDGDQTVTVIVSVDVAQSHDAFEGLADRTVTVLARDDDEPAPPRILITETGRDTRVRESGTYDSIMVALGTRPASDVVVSATSEDVSEVQVTSATLTFTPSDWGIPRAVVVRGIDDFVRDGNRDVTITLSVVSPVSADVYDGTAARVTVRNDDDERGGRRGGGDDDEGGGG